MPGIIIMHSFKLKEGSSVADFMHIADEIQTNVKKDYSYKLLRDGDSWSDMCIFETEEDFNTFTKNISEVHSNPYIKKFQSFLDRKSITRKRFTVEKSY